MSEQPPQNPPETTLTLTICRNLIQLWPDTTPQLQHENCWQLLIAVILSAQCTDDQVNQVTPQLFALWPNAAALAGADPDKVCQVIHSTGFFRAKTAHIIASSKIILEQFGSHVPNSLTELLRLPGVGRKTANLVLSACFDQPGLIVDTHVLRSCRRLGISNAGTAEQVERTLAAALPPEIWTASSHALNRHGKFVCFARKPDCRACALRPLCPSAKQYLLVSAGQP